MAATPDIGADPDRPGQAAVNGDWVLANAASMEAAVSRLPRDTSSLDASGIGRLDTAGAMRLLEAADDLGLAPEKVQIRDEHRALLALIRRSLGDGAEAGAGDEPGWKRLLAHIGRAMSDLFANLRGLVGFLGLVLATLAGTVLRPARLRLTSTVHHMEQTGLDAVPLVALLSFLVGAVVAFLGATVLRDFGAELFVIDLVSYAFLREFGVLLTAILLAGRTASAFAAQIGTMKGREEIDAIRTIGLNEIELLVIPRLLALVIMLPLLAFIAVVAGLAGGLAVAVTSLGMTPDLYVSRLQETVQLRHYLVGLSKAPIFALVIALVGCREGFRVIGTAQSVGERTTSAVVQSISLVIVINAMAAVFFMEVGL